MILSSSQFSFKNNTFSAFMSDIEYALRQIYPDAADTGFEMVSERTGKTVKFVETGRTENEFFFEPLREEIRKNPLLAGIKVKVLNT